MPSLELGKEPDISFDELLDRFELGLREGDKASVLRLRQFYDVLNLRLLWQGEEIDKRGLLPLDELESAVEHKENLPKSVIDFLWDYEGDGRLAHFPMLLSHYLLEQERETSGFLRDYFRFEREWRLILSAFRAKQLGLDLAEVFKEEEESDPMIVSLMANKDAAQFAMPYGYTDLEKALSQSVDNPMEMYQAFAQFRFERIREMTLGELLSLDWLLGYTVRLSVVLEWNEMQARNEEELLSNSRRYG